MDEMFAEYSSIGPDALAACFPIVSGPYDSNCLFSFNIRYLKESAFSTEPSTISKFTIFQSSFNTSAIAITNW
ncbi:hypothetical protein E2C01_039316 [Portunus trituberculatus]|uniref:Uncharacterized protein n=1 Tax=Portunus trituberculatus TaxID=210409 RepID=A0A5B7FEF6_PORTR|nr:hypothetical protein [Portunus trituberculatus]